MAGFKKAVKREAKGRVALVGPSGSGKSFTALTLARALAGHGGTIAAVDTEHGSLSKYAHTDSCGGPGVCQAPDHFDFDVEDLNSFSPAVFLFWLNKAITDGYKVFLCDSLSHFWMGKDGALEFVDMARKRSSSRDDMAGWKDFSPVERKMVDAMIAAPLHIIVTMRTKTDYQEVEYTRKDGSTGKKREKIGLAPVQRQGLEYEFDLIGYMDEKNTFIVDKTRCSALADQALSKPGLVDFAPFIDWLQGAKPVAQTPAQPVPQIAIAGATARLSEEEAKKLWLFARQHKWHEDDLRVLIGHHGFASIRDVTRDKLASIETDIGKGIGVLELLHLGTAGAETPGGSEEVA